jgi:tetratricopeptide (TPR) repeat protein
LQSAEFVKKFSFPKRTRKKIMSQQKRSGKIRIFKIIAACMFFAATVFAQPQNAAQTLATNQKIEGELRGGEKKSFSVKAEKGNFVAARIDQRGIDLTVKIFAPDASLLLERDTPNGAYGAESVSFVAATSGIYRLEIAPLEETAPAGAFAVELETTRAPNEKDLLRVQTETVFDEAMQLRRKNAPETNEAAQAKFAEAIKNFQALGDKYREANALAALAFTALDLKQDAEKSLQMINRALGLAREIADRHLEKLALANLGDFYFQAKDFEKAVDFYRQSLALSRNLGDEIVQIIALQGIGNAAYEIKQWQKSIDAYAEVLALRRARGERAAQAQTLHIIGLLYDAKDERKTAIAFYERAAALFAELKDAAGEAQALENSGYDLSVAEENEKAIAAYEKAIVLRLPTFARGLPRAQKRRENRRDAQSRRRQSRQQQRAAKSRSFLRRIAQGISKAEKSARRNNRSRKHRAKLP